MEDIYSISLPINLYFSDQFHAIKHLTSTAPNRIIKYLLIILLLLGIYIDFFSTQNGGARFLSQALPVLILGWVATSGYVPALRLWYYMRRHPDARHLNLTIERDGLNYQSEKINSKITWDNYEKAFESSRVFVLSKEKWQFNVIPKHAFSSDEEISFFRYLIESNIGEIQKFK